MGVLNLIFALFIAGYILGVWTACVVLRQPQRPYEDGAPWPAVDHPLFEGEVVPARSAGVELPVP